MDSHEEKIRKLISTMKTESSFITALKPIILRNLKVTTDIYPDFPTEDAEKDIDKILERIGGPKRIIEIAVKIYKSYFTEPEIEDMIVFFESSTGKKYIGSSPQIAIEMNDRICEIGTVAVKQLIKELEKSEEAPKDSEEKGLFDELFDELWGDNDSEEEVV